MAKEKKPKERITKKLLYKYRLVILNEETFEERFALKLTRLNVFVVLGFSMILLIALTTVLIAFTPLREYIPGYSSAKLRKQATHLVYKTDSLERVVQQKNRYFASIQKMLTGDMDELENTHDDDANSSQEPAGEKVMLNEENINLNPSKAETELRKEVERKEKYTVPASPKRTSLHFFAPVKGRVTDTFNLEKNHLATDIAVKKDMPVKNVAQGVVIFTGWTVNTGNVIIVEHPQGFVSIYKHNSSLVKKQGDTVEAGEVIAIAGSTGKYSTGTHLHFELWDNGTPVNPEKFIDFE